MSSYATYWESHCGWMFGEEANLNKANRSQMHLSAYSDALNKTCKIFEELESTENSPQVVHCHYQDLKRDPVEAIRKMYAEMGRKFTPKFEANLHQRFAEMEHIHKQSPYSTSLEGTSLTRDDILDAYSYYLKKCPVFNQ